MENNKENGELNTTNPEMDHIELDEENLAPCDEQEVFDDTVENTNETENMQEDKSSDENSENNKSKKKYTWAVVGLAAVMFGASLGGGFLGLKLAMKYQTVKNLEQYKVSIVDTLNNKVNDLTDVSDIVEEVMPSIVSITSMTQMQHGFGWNLETYETPSSGSGVIYSKSDGDLFIVTNYHVIANSSSLSVGWFDGTTSKAEIVGYSEVNDLALVKVHLSDITEKTVSNLKIAVFGDSDKCKVGEGTIAIGNAMGYGQTVTEGIVSALNRELKFEDGRSMYMLQTSAAINPGNSGGALLNARGEIIGINSAKLADATIEGMGYAIPSNTVNQVVNNILEGKPIEETGPVTLGIKGYDVNDSMANIYKMPKGVCIQEITPETPAEKAKLMPGDIITGINDIPVTSIVQLKSMLEGIERGSSINLKIQRQENDSYTEKIVTIKF